MKKNLSVFSASVLSLTILAGVAGNAYAKSEFDEVAKFGFTAENKLDGDELSGLRGGMRIGSLDFDFAITSRTFVDGVLQHTSTFNSSNLEKVSLKDIANGAAKKLVTEVVPSTANIPPVSVAVNTGGAPGNSPVNVSTNDVASASNPSDNVPGVVSQSGNLSTGVGVTINTGSLATTIQNSNDNAVIQQQNQMDLVVSNLSVAQKVNIAQQMDFLAAQSAR